ncbi:MAG: type II secretion system GspH family protein [Oligoflexia bacterium]|nr:type II secretion system GspH family protein [Oligoflexia bacterium]
MSRRRAGFTLIEILVGLGLLGIAAYGMSTAFLYQNQLANQLDRQDALSELIQSNVLELEAGAVTDLPPDGQCKVRRYGEKGAFESEALLSLSHPECQSPEPASPGMRIVITASPVDPSSASFKNGDGSANAFLKLPTSVSTLRAVRLQAGGRSTQSTRVIRLSLTMFKQ